MRLSTVLAATRYVTWAFLLLSAPSALAQNALTGSVKDRTGAALPGATITATNTGTDASTTTVSDAQGKYSFASLDGGSYRVVAKLPGFSARGVTVSISGATTQDFTLNLGALQEEVTVTAAKGLRASSEIPQVVNVVTTQELEDRRPISTADAYDKTPSMMQTDPNPYRARPMIRGLQSSRLLVTVDGDRMNNARFGANNVGVSPSLIDPSQIEAIEIVAGAASSLHGSDAIGGTINIVTKSPQPAPGGERFDLRADVDYGSNNDYRKLSGTLGYGADKFAARFSITNFDSPSYKMGGDPITREEVIKFGNLAVRAGTPIGQAMASQYAVFSLPANAEVNNSDGKGTTYAGDIGIYPSNRQTFRVRFQSNRYKNLGVPFSGIPSGNNEVRTNRSDFDKFSGKYEIRQISQKVLKASFSLSYQEYERTLDEQRFGITTGSSHAAGALNGGLSTFALTSKPFTIQNNKQWGGDFQVNIAPFKDALYITGVNFSSDKSHDTFENTTFSAATGAVTSTLRDSRNTPDSTLNNIGWYNQIEFTKNRVRLAGGFRYDNWKTEAKPTPGFPVGNFAALINAGLPFIRQNPQSLDITGIEGVDRLASGAGSIKTDKNVGTYNVGVTLLLDGGVHPYARYATSFREPDIISRYLLRNFSTQPFFSVPGLTNTNLKPEKGKTIDVGVKINRERVRALAGYFETKLTDAIDTALGTYCITPNPAAGIIATPPGFGCPLNTHLAQYFQSVNSAKVKQNGFEFQLEGDIQVGDLGSITPVVSLSTIKSVNQTPDVSRKTVIATVYNSSSPIELEGSADDVPFYSLPDYQGAFAPRFTAKSGKWWLEYEWRFLSKIKRVDPNEISFAGVTQYSYFAAYKGFDKHSIRAGARLGASTKTPINIVAQLDNLTDELYFLGFQAAPAMGRSFQIGATINWSKIK